MPELFDLIVKNGLVVSPDSTLEADVAVKDGRVAAISGRGMLPDNAKRVIDAKGKYVLPGGVDPHVHFSFAGAVPNLNSKSGVSQAPDAGTIAAACGGTTTVLDFAVPRPGTTLVQGLEDKRAVFEGHSAVDYGFHVMLPTDSLSFDLLDQVPTAIDYGAPSIKTRTIDNQWMVDDGWYWGLLERLAEHGGISVLHAEDQAIVMFARQRCLRDGKREWLYAAQARPSLAEDAAIRRAIFLARHTGAALYILHMAAKEGVWNVAEARHKGLPVFGETCHCYLCFTADDLDRPDGVLYNNHPTVKFAEDRDALWKGLADGSMSVVATDDFTTHRADKITQGITIENMRGGHNGVETRLAILFSEGVSDRRLSVNEMVRVASTNPARIFGLYPTKGILAPGSDADIVVIDPQLRKTLSLADLHAASDYSIYEGRLFHGYPVMTIARGKVIVENGKYSGTLHDGRFLARHMDPRVLKGPVC